MTYYIWNIFIFFQLLKSHLMLTNEFDLDWKTTTSLTSAENTMILFLNNVTQLLRDSILQILS
jgi:hypothetical protein